MQSYSGKFVLRIPSVMHKELCQHANSKRRSLNQICIELLNAGIEAEHTNKPGFSALLNEINLKLKKFFGGKLIGIVLFGSQATGNATNESDIDLLIVLDENVPIERSLYRWWDDNIEWNGENALNPHFVNLPATAKNVGGLWLEVATTGKILYQKKTILDKLFAEINTLINKGLVRMFTSNGHSYWKWRLS